MMSESLSPILQWINQHPELAGLITFIISAGESIAIIGTIVPGSVTMTAIGALMGAGIIPFWSTMLWAIAGAIIGDGVSYWAGHYFKDRMHYVWPFRKHPQILQGGERFFYRYGSLSVFIGRFVGPVRALVPLVAGMFGVTPLRFTIANVLSAILWAPAYMLPGIFLGAVSMELPSELATRVILMLITVCLIVALCFWLLKKIFQLISAEIDQFLTWIWNHLANSRYFYIVTSALKHHKTNKTYGQLALAFYFIVVAVLFIYVTSVVQYHGSPHILINNMFFHFFRSIRTESADTIMFCFTLLGEKKVILPIFVTLFAWLITQKRWHTAWHVISLAAITSISIELVKHYVKSPRPWGVLSNNLAGFSYPSGHTTLAFVFFLGISILLIQLFQIKYRRFVYIPAFFIITLVAISRLYFGVHWFTDVLGGALLGTAILILITLSYNRKAEKTLKAKGILLTIFFTWCVTFSFAFYQDFHSLKNKYAMLTWPTTMVALNTWWQQQSDHFPLYRYNRLGLAPKLFNVQWLGNESDINTTLLHQGWEMPPKRDWISVLYRITSVQSNEHLPLISPIYLDKYPVLILTKHINQRLLVLRLWESPFILQNTHLPLYVGTIEYAPGTYSWLFNKRENEIVLEPNMIFNTLSKRLETKEIFIKTIHHKKTTIENIILIKPKTLQQS